MKARAWTGIHAVFAVLALVLVCHPGAGVIEVGCYIALRHLGEGINPVNSNTYLEMLEFTALVNRLAQDPAATISHSEYAALSLRQRTAIDRLRSANALSRWRVGFAADFASYESLSQHVGPNGRPLLARILSDPWAELTPHEQSVLSSCLSTIPNGVERVRQLSQRHGNGIQALRFARSLYGYAFATAFATAILGPWLGTENVSRENAAIGDPIRDDEFELIFEPNHTLFRVGDFVYEYHPGPGVRRRTYAEFKAKEGSAYHTRVRLRVAESERAKLKQFMDEEEGHRFLFWPMPHVSTCVSNANRAIEKNTCVTIPAGIDRSLLFTQTYFKTRALFGDPQVVHIRSYWSGSSRANAGARTHETVHSVIDGLATTLMFPELAIGAQWDRTEKGFTYK